MKKYRKIIIGTIIFVVILLSMIISGNSSNGEFNNITIKKYYELLNSDATSYVYVGRPTCSHCVAFTPILKKYATDNKLSINYLNTDEFSQTEFDKLNTELSAVIGEDWAGSTPTLLTIGNGQVVKYKVGYDTTVGDTDLISYFGINALENTTLNEITIDQYQQLIAEKNDSAIMIGRPTCIYCVRVTPILEKIQDERNIVINYLNIDKLDQAGYETLTNSFEQLKEFGTPYIMIVKDKKIVAHSEGYKEYTELDKFFADNGM